jgi:hypothetical protein
LILTGGAGKSGSRTAGSGAEGMVTMMESSFAISRNFIATGGISNISARNKCSEKLPEYAATRGQLNANARYGEGNEGTKRKASAVMTTSFGKPTRPARPRRPAVGIDYASKPVVGVASRFS